MKNKIQRLEQAVLTLIQLNRLLAGRVDDLEAQLNAASGKKPDGEYLGRSPDSDGGDTRDV